MKPSIALVLLAAILLAAGRAAGQGAANIIKQRATELRDQNNVQQGVASPAPPANPATATRPLTPHEKALVRLKNDLSAIKPDAPATAATKVQLAKDLLAVAEGAHKPTPATANKLAESLASGLSGKLLATPLTYGRLTVDLNAILNPEKLPETQLAKIVADIQAVFQANTLDRKPGLAVANNAKALADEVRHAAAPPPAAH
jgi:hypothetical protein